MNQQYLLYLKLHLLKKIYLQIVNVNTIKLFLKMNIEYLLFQK